MNTESTSRKIVTTINAVATSDGDGVKIARSIGSNLLPQLDPFLLLDELKSDEAADYMGGFPSHPHRGFETVTYMLEGQMRHKDSAGNKGLIRSGDIQWMTAGSGIIHSEMPEQEEGRMWGFQLWINLPAAQKMRAPRYQEIASSDVPEVNDDGAKVRVLAGECNGVMGSVQDIATQPMLLDVELKNRQTKKIEVPEKHTAIVYIYKGSLSIEGRELQAQQLGHLSSGESLELISGDDGVGALILAAAPLNEPIVRAGPFVMNTQQELEQAFSDFRSGKFLTSV
jgi:redox-sensitive bicupin YhaK (pirin superfamily)